MSSSSITTNKEYMRQDIHQQEKRLIDSRVPISYWLYIVRNYVDPELDIDTVFKNDPYALLAAVFLRKEHCMNVINDLDHDHTITSHAPPTYNCFVIDKRNKRQLWKYLKYAGDNADDVFKCFL